MSELAVTLTIEQLGELVEVRVAKAVAQLIETQEREVLDLTHAAKLLKRHPKVLMKMVRSENIPVHFISGREPRFRRSELLAWLSAQPSDPAARQLTESK